MERTQEVLVNIGLSSSYLSTEATRESQRIDQAR